MDSKDSIFLKIIKFASNSGYRFGVLANRGLYDSYSDYKYIKKQFKARMGYDLDLKNPKTFNEKIQWLKLYYRRNKFTIWVDKYRVREYISKVVGEEYLVPLLGVWDNVEDIDFSALPEKFVLKCNHNSAKGLCICKDKKKLNIEKVKKELKLGLAEDYYLKGREWPYHNVPRKIIAEKYLENSDGTEIVDYKFMCFGGKVKCSFVCSERFSLDGLKVTFFDREWNRLNFERHYPSSKQEIKKPSNYDKMIDIAEELSKGEPFLRVDFFEVNNKLYIGELTLYPGNGTEEFTPFSADLELGSWIDLPNK